MDNLALLLAPSLEKKLGVQTIIDNQQQTGGC